jgi:hypothetical protein
MTGRTRSQGRTRRKPTAELDARLDKALAQTFPASDPFSVGRFTSTEPPSRPIDYKPPVLVSERRRRLKKL